MKEKVSGGKEEEKETESELINSCFRSNDYTRDKAIKIESKKISLQDIMYLIDKKDTTTANKLMFIHCQLGCIEIKELARGNWTHLEQLIIRGTISGREIKNETVCKQLISLRAQNIKYIDLSQNSIGPKSGKYLAQAKWNKLEKLNLQNLLGEQVEEEEITFVGWKVGNFERGKIFEPIFKISQINGVKELIKNKWIHLTQLLLGSNMINDRGCKWLSQSQWIHLKKILLPRNLISDVGCQWLSKSNWLQLGEMQISWNYINWAGCKYLSCSNWQKLSVFGLRNGIIDNVDIRNEGCLYFFKSNWKELQKINISHSQGNNKEFLHNLLQQYFPKLKRAWL